MHAHKLPLARLEALTSRLLFTSSQCPSCAPVGRHGALRILRSRSSIRSLLSANGTRSRSIAHASSTAINAQKDIPPRLNELHRALEVVKHDAANYINISRLGLALRSLESRRPTIRVALLGLRSTTAARKLAHLLLADVLSEKGEWERRLQELDDNDQGGLLLRYGEETSLTATSILTTFYVPSRLLQQHNIEILVSSLNISAGLPTGPVDTGELRRTALVPTAETPRTFKGDVSFVTYPVHRAIVLAEGIQGCLALGRYASLNLDKDSGTGSALQLAVNLPRVGSRRKSNTDHVPGIAVLDLEQGEQAIETFRESNTNAVAYEQQWHRSGISQLSSWLAEGYPEAHEQDENPAVTALVSDLVSEASRNIMLEDDALSLQASQQAALEPAKLPLNEALDQWAMRAHSELRSELDTAFESKRWARMRWFKLFWRVDDVSATITELLGQYWLRDAENGIIWLSGRSVEAGFDVFSSTLPSDPAVEATTSTMQQVGAATSASDATSLLQRPWPSLIPQARAALARTTAPDLQATAQSLLVQTITITGATSGLAAMIYLALPTASLYSTGAVAALGLVWSLRHLQRRWEHLRASWESELHEAGRVTLKEMEESFRGLLSLPKIREQDVTALDRAKARQAVHDVEICLRKLGKQ